MLRKTTHTIIKEVPTYTWSLPADYAHGVEVVSIGHLYRRSERENSQRAVRFEFYMLVCVTSGEMMHALDFQKIPVATGGWLLARPGQVQQFNYTEGLDGWVVLFRADFLPPAERGQQSMLHWLADQLAGFPSMTQLSGEDHGYCTELVARLRADLQASMGDQERNALLMFQLATLLIRLKACHQQTGKTDDPALKVEWERVSRLRQLIDLHFREQHSASWYADKLGVTIKTLGRATQTVTGQTPKELITARIMLEAKRQLVHSRRQIQSIAHDLGFDEFSHFVKFFKKEASNTPRSFREQWQGSGKKNETREA